MTTASTRLMLDHQLCFALYRASLAMTRAYQPLLADLGLTYPQYLALLALWERDGQSVCDLGQRLGLDSGTLTPLLKRLEAQALLERNRDADDERRVRLHLTPAGHALKQRAARIPGRALARCGLTVEAAQALAGELHALRSHLLS